jgi:hypothetical protein
VWNNNGFFYISSWFSIGGMIIGRRAEILRHEPGPLSLYQPQIPPAFV